MCYCAYGSLCVTLGSIACAGYRFWKQLLSVGYLCQFESLVSTHGQEEGMLQDYAGSMRMLECTSLR